MKSRITDSNAPYAGLTPDAVLDALEATGLKGDGRLLALNSFENRVYQVGIEDDLPVIVKFYRPARWSDEQIIEEHSFVHELVDREIPVVAPLVINGSTLHRHGQYRFAIYPRQGGRAPELEDDETLAWMGRFIGRIHAVGALRPFAKRPAIDIKSFGEESRDWLLSNDFIPDDLIDAWSSTVNQVLEIGRAHV